MLRVKLEELKTNYEKIGMLVADHDWEIRKKN